MIAGPDGSGKTTLTKRIAASDVDLGTYINPDDIAAGLQGTYAARVMAAQIQADRLRDGCLSAGTTFSFETVMSHPSKVRILERAGTAGFEVAVYFVATESPLINVARVRHRVALGGHDVPEDRIVQRYHRCLELLPSAIRASDTAVLSDSTRQASDGGASMRAICRLARLDGGAIVIADRTLDGGPIPEWVARALLAVAIDPVSLRTG